MQKRELVTCVILSIVTFGIYGIFWFISITNDSNSLAPKNQTASGGVAFLLSLITFGIYGIYWAYKLGDKIDEMNGQNASTGVMYLILNLFGLSIVTYCLAQNEINKKVA